MIIAPPPPPPRAEIVGGDIDERVQESASLPEIFNGWISH